MDGDGFVYDIFGGTFTSSTLVLALETLSRAHMWTFEVAFTLFYGYLLDAHVWRGFWGSNPKS